MNLIAFGSPGPLELGILLIFGLLIFGKRLPDVGRSIGQTVVQFKKGLNEVHSELDVASTPTSASRSDAARPVLDQPTSPKVELDPSAFKFDPLTGEPIKRA